MPARGDALLLRSSAPPQVGGVNTSINVTAGSYRPFTYTEKQHDGDSTDKHWGNANESGNRGGPPPSAPLASDDDDDDDVNEATSFSRRAGAEGVGGSSGGGDDDNHSLDPVSSDLPTNADLASSTANRTGATPPAVVMMMSMSDFVAGNVHSTGVSTGGGGAGGSGTAGNGRSQSTMRRRTGGGPQ